MSVQTFTSNIGFIILIKELVKKTQYQSILVSINDL